MSYLRDKYLEANPDVISYNEGNAIDFVDAFIDFARQELINNQAVSTEQLAVGLSLRLQDATVVPLVPADSKAVMEGVSGFQQVNEGAPGKGVDPGQSWNITK